MKKPFYLGLVALGLFAPAAASADTALSASGFVDTMGVATHIVYKDGAYANWNNVANDLAYLGITHIRDSVPGKFGAGTSQVPEYVALAGKGIKFSLLPGLPSNMPNVDAIATAAPGAIEAIEGFNEINNWGVTYNGLTGEAAADAAMADLYKAVKADTLLGKIPVIDMTGAAKANTIAGRADFANSHPYPHNGNQPGTTVSASFAYNAYGMTGAFPKVITEVGNFSLPASYVATTDKPWWDGYTMLGVDEATQAKSIVNTYFDAVTQGISRTYVYELLDEKADATNKAPEMHFGLFRNDQSPKPSATAVRNVVSLLKTNGTTTVNTFAKGALTYTIDNLPTTARKLLLQKADGTFVLALWNEVPFWTWNQYHSTPINSAPVQVMLQLSQMADSITVYDPLVGATPILNKTKLQGLNLNLTDHVILVAITLSTPAAACGSTQSGSTVWVSGTAGSSSAVATVAQCPYSGTVTTSWTNQTQQLCTNGVLSNTGQTQKINVVVAKPVCNAAKACGTTASGSTAWVNGTAGSSVAAATVAQCSYGGTVTTTWTNQTQQLCTNGVLSNTTQTQQANVVVGKPVCKAPPPVPTGMNVTYQAENMSGTNAPGAPSNGFFEIWANGYIEQAGVAFPATAAYTFDVKAKADLALNVGAAVEVRVDGVKVGGFTVTTLNDYLVSANVTAGTHKVEIAFTNDYWNATTKIDRNLYVDYVKITSGATSTPVATTTKFSATYQAETMAQNAYGLVQAPYFNMLGAGYLEQAGIAFPVTGAYTFDVRAFADVALNVGAVMEVRVDNVKVASATVTSLADYVVTANVTVGTHKVEIAFTNDYWDPAKNIDRNLHVDYLTIHN